LKDVLQVLTTHYQAARELGQTGDHIGALAAYQELLPDQVRVLGAEHKLTLMTSYSLAYALGQTGDRAGALTAYQVLPPKVEGALELNNPISATIQMEIDKHWACGEP
jgi:hypothetical protein